MLQVTVSYFYEGLRQALELDPAITGEMVIAAALDRIKHRPHRDLAVNLALAGIQALDGNSSRLEWPTGHQGGGLGNFHQKITRHHIEHALMLRRTDVGRHDERAMKIQCRPCACAPVHARGMSRTTAPHHTVCQSRDRSGCQGDRRNCAGCRNHLPRCMGCANSERRSHVLEEIACSALKIVNENVGTQAGITEIDAEYLLSFSTIERILGSCSGTIRSVRTVGRP